MSVGLSSSFDIFCYFFFLNIFPPRTIIITPFCSALAFTTLENLRTVRFSIPPKTEDNLFDSQLELIRSFLDMRKEFWECVLVKFDL